MCRERRPAEETEPRELALSEWTTVLISFSSLPSVLCFIQSQWELPCRDRELSTSLQLPPLFSLLGRGWDGGQGQGAKAPQVLQRAHAVEKRKKSCSETRGFSESSDRNGMGAFLPVFHVWWTSGHRRLFLTKGRLWVSFLSTIQGPWRGAPHSQSVGPLGITNWTLQRPALALPSFSLPECHPSPQVE